MINNIDFFDANFYIKAYKDIRLSRIDACTHYREHGIHEKRLPSLIYFNYLYPDFNLKKFKHEYRHHKSLKLTCDEEFMAFFHQLNICQKHTYRRHTSQKNHFNCGSNHLTSSDSESSESDEESCIDYSYRIGPTGPTGI
jgi:hypothetical protein